MSSLMDPKNYDLNSTSTRKNLPQPCPLLRVRSKGLEYSRPLEAACQFVANLPSLGYFFIFHENEQYFVLTPPDRKQSRPIGLSSYIGWHNKLLFISFNQLSPGRACGYGCMNFFSVKLDRNFRSDLNTTNLRVLLLPSHS